ncbi:MAG: hypothetical protein ACUVQ7_04885 [bacterium]
MKWLLAIAVVSLAVSTGFAKTWTYGWEDCGTVLHVYPEGYMIATNVMQPVNSGEHALELEDRHPSGTPEAHLIFIYGLQPGDVVTAGFYVYDVTPGGEPSARIWANYNDSQPPDPLVYSGSASGNSAYSSGIGWEYMSYRWVIASPHIGIEIQCRTYSNPGVIVWVDDLDAQAPDREGVNAMLPAPGASATEESSWGQIKALYR